MSIPALHGNWIDLIIVILLIIYAWDSWRDGFFALVARMVGFVGSFLLALRYYPLGAKQLIANFSLPLGLSNAASFVFIALISEIGLGLLVNQIYKHFPQKLFRSRANKILAPIPAVLDALILIAFFANILISLPISGALKHDIITSRLGGNLINHTQSIEKTLSDIFGGAASDTLGFLTVSRESQETVNLHFTTNQYSTDLATENEMLTLVNQERTSRGFKALIMDEKLRAVARAHSRDMFARGYFSHYTPEGQSPFDRMKTAGIDFQSAGENIAYAPSLSLAHQGLMNSPGHRANILSPDFGRIGIGVIDAGIYGRVFTQDFTN